MHYAVRDALQEDGVRNVVTLIRLGANTTLVIESGETVLGLLKQNRKFLTETDYRSLFQMIELASTAQKLEQLKVNDALAAQIGKGEIIEKEASTRCRFEHMLDVGSLNEGLEVFKGKLPDTVMQDIVAVKIKKLEELIQIAKKDVISTQKHLESLQRESTEEPQEFNFLKGDMADRAQEYARHQEYQMRKEGMPSYIRTVHSQLLEAESRLRSLEGRIIEIKQLQDRI